ncbi:ABC transporter substrate-binding protein [Bibersteinia trehalosi]|uniref:ABC transporter substrate-binding protein n=1 Tax=Bibersteinia trehalosi TaxID=47735 RepID=UPI003D278D67
MKLKLQALIFSLFCAKSALSAPSIPANLLQDSLVYCTSVSGFSFNPQKADLGTNMNVVTEQIYDKLLSFDAESNTLKPALAKRFEVSDDGLEITFYLRENVAFHQTSWFTPTRFFNAEDVLFSLNRVIGQENADLSMTHKEEQSEIQRNQSDLARVLASRTHFPFFESIDLKSKIAKISAPSSHVVKIYLTKPDNSLLSHLASQFAVILSKEYALQLNADENLVMLDLLPVGTGVYQLESYIQNDSVRLKANPHYWGEKAHISHMIVDFSTSGTGRMAKFLNGECDVAAFPEPSQLQILKDEKGYLVERSGANLAYLAFNFDRAIAHDITLRKRITQAINRQRIVQMLFYGRAEVPQNVVPQVLAAVENLTSYPYQEIQHRQEPQFDNKPLMLWVVDEKRVYNANPMKMAEMIRFDLAQAGIPIKVKAVSRAYLTQRLEEEHADYDMILSGWLANDFDPDSFLSSMLACQAKNSVTNLANWCNDEFDHVLNYARLTQDNALRQLLYLQAQRMLEEQLPLFPLVNVKRLLVANNDVEKVDITPFGQVNLSKMRLK